MDTAPFNVNALPASIPSDEPTHADRDWGVSLPRLTLEFPAAAPLRRAVALSAKRLIDLTGAVAGLALLAPVLLALALLIRFDSPGPILFRQRRTGRFGRLFWVYKFRTMRADAEQRLAELEGKNEAAGGVLFKIKDDPRVTPLGTALRRTNLDELPQLWNVLRGEMSLVGPRPLQMRDCERLKALDSEAFARRLEVPPGLTGAWQVGRGDPTDSQYMLNFDLDYIERWSLALDLRLIFRTLFIVIAGFRPH